MCEPHDAISDLSNGQSSILPSGVAEWSPADVANWVSEVLRLPEYGEVMEACRIDGPTLLELPEDLLETELLITNPIHRKKIIAHAKLLGGMPSEQLATSPQQGRRSERTPRSPATPSSASQWSAGACASAVRQRSWDDQCAASDYEEQDFMSSAGAASLQRGQRSAASSTGGTGMPGASDVTSTFASSRPMRRKEPSTLSCGFYNHGDTLAERAAVRRGRSMDRVALLQRNLQVRRSGGSGAASARSSQSADPTPRQQQGLLSGRGPGKVLSIRGKQVNGWGQLSPSCSRRGSWGRSAEQGSPRCDVLAKPAPFADDPTTSYYYKESFERSTQGTVLSPSSRQTLEFRQQGTKTPGPGTYKPKARWQELQIGGAIGAADRFRYDRRNCGLWLRETEDD
jgi:hypothetical protein